MRRRALILGIALLVTLPVFSQVKDQLIWSSSLADDSEEEYRKNYLRIARGGYQLDLEALSINKVRVSFTDLPVITRSIPGAADGLAFNYQNRNGQSQEVFVNRNDVREQLKKQFEIYLDEEVTRMKIRGSVEEYKKKQTKEFQLVLKGKRQGVKWKKYSWPIEVGTVQDLDPAIPYSLSFVCRKVPYARLDFDSLYSDLAVSLPQVNNENCQPFDRYTYFRRYFSLNYTGFPYRPYRPRSGVPRKKNFRLYFDKSSASYSRHQINDIIKYLNDSNLVIQTAKVLAYASVEGDSAINMRLQEERAMVLMQTLEKANNDSIEIKLETREDWGQFNAQLSGSPYKNKYTHSEWKELLRNDSIEARFEKFLKKQRRAELFLTLTERLSEEQKVTVAFGDFHRYVRRYQPNARPEVRLRQVQRIFSIKKYLEIQAYRGVADTERVCSLFPPSVNEYHIVQLYETALAIKEGRPLVCQNLEDLIKAAHFSALDMIETYGDQRLYLQQALDIQSFAYEMVSKGEVGPEILCHLIYPDERRYYDLILNKLYYQDHQGFDYSQNLPCLGSYLDEGQTTDRKFASTDKVIAQTETPSSQYYFVLKKIVLENDEYMQRLVERSDHILQFDIFEFLYYNVMNWNVFDNQFFDPEVTPEIMAQQFDRLKSMKGVICPNQVYTLTLTFYLKVMDHALVIGEANDLTSEAIDFISHYYQDNADKIDDRLALAVAKQIMALTPLYYRNEPAKEAFDVLRLRDWKEPLKGEALNYYLNLVNLVPKDSGERLLIMERKYPNDVWDSFFTGKYSIPEKPNAQ